MYTIVIIDDKLNKNPAFISSVNWKECGFELIGYSDIGAEGLKLIENLNPDILITETNVKDEDGADFAERARKIKPNLEIIFFTENKEFNNAKKAISLKALDYIVKPVAAVEFEKILETIRKSIEEKSLKKPQINAEEFKIYYLSSLLMQKQAEEEIKQKIENLNLNLNKEEFVIVNISFLIYKSENKKTALTFYNMVKNIFKKYLKGESLIYNGIITLIISDSNANINKNLNSMITDIAQSLEGFPGIKSIIGISNGYHSLSLTPIAYAQAKNALLYSFREKNEIIFFKDIKRTELGAVFFENLKNDLEKKIRFETVDSVKKYIEIVFNEIKINRISLSNFYMCLFEIVSVCNNIEQNEFNQTLKFSFLESIINNQSIDLIQNKISEKCCELCKKIIDQKQNGVEKIVNQAIMLIEENYKNPDFSLKILSDELHISSNYLCAIVKKIKKDSFINLLTKVRMNKAKELLCCTNSRIQEIAYEVGYTDQHYFSYCFKKFYDITPKEMRERKPEII